MAEAFPLTDLPNTLVMLLRNLLENNILNGWSIYESNNNNTVNVNIRFSGDSLGTFFFWTSFWAFLWKSFRRIRCVEIERERKKVLRITERKKRCQKKVSFKNSSSSRMQASGSNHIPYSSIFHHHPSTNTSLNKDAKVSSVSIIQTPDTNVFFILNFVAITTHPILIF